jgi:hypothetical protein
MRGMLRLVAFTTAIYYYSQGIRWCNGDNVDALAVLYTNRATALYHAKHYDLALMDVDYALTLAPAYDKAICRRGDIYVALQRWNDAIYDLTRVTPTSLTTSARTCFEKVEKVRTMKITTPATTTPPGPVRAPSSSPSPIPLTQQHPTIHSACGSKT